MRYFFGLSDRRFFIFWFVIVMGCFSVSFAWSQVAMNPPEDAQAIEEIEEIEEIEVVESTDSSGFLTILGRMHPAVVHFPIGWLMMVLLIDLGAFILGRENWEKWGLYALGGTVLSFFPAIMTGFLNASTLPEDSPILSLMATHRNLNLLVTVLCIAAFALRFQHRDRPLQGGVKWTYLGLILVAAALIGLAGHLGGKMVFGENYLPF